MIETMRFEKADGVAVATFNRPEVLNAFRSVDRAELREVLHEVATDPAVRALVVTGAGRAFSAGQDLAELGEQLGMPRGLDEAAAELEALQDVTRAVLALPKPVIAAVNGVAVGLGAELALACDVRLAAPEASIGFVEVRRGLFETNGVMWLLPRLVGLGVAARLLLTGERIDAEAAERVGLFSEVVPAGELVDRAIELGRTIASNAPITVRLVKQVLARTYDVSLEEMLGLEVAGVLECLQSDDLQEGTAAFLERRPAHYQGR